MVDTIFKINDFSSNIYYHNSKIYESSRVIHSEVFRKIYPTVAIYYDIHFLINFANLDVCFEGRFMLSLKGNCACNHIHQEQHCETIYCR